MGIFGWSLPPGVTSRMIDNAYGSEGPCEVCGIPVDACICPECPTCGSVGDLVCYGEHGLVRSEAQIVSFQLTNAYQVLQGCADNVYGAELDQIGLVDADLLKACAVAKLQYDQAVANLIGWSSR